MSEVRRNAVYQTTLPVAVAGERKLRMIVLGASRVGKTQLVSRFMGMPFSEAYIPTVEDFHRKMYTIKGHTYQLDILDTAGATINPLTQKITLMTGDMFLVVYSITEESSFEYAKELVRMIEDAKVSLLNDAHQHNGNRSKKKNLRTYTPIIIAGNKVDMAKQRTVPVDAAADWLRETQKEARHLCTHVDVSARDLASVQVLFERLFVLAHLPLEMSPNMHRKVSAHTFFETTAASVAQHRRLGSPLFNRSVSEDCSGKRNRRVWQSIKQHSRRSNRGSPPSPGSSSSGSVLSGSSDDYEFFASEEFKHDRNPAPVLISPDVSSDAVATVLPNQRRPSTTTEVNIALSKARVAHAVPKCYDGSHLAVPTGHHAQANFIHCHRGTHKDTSSPFQRLKSKLGRMKSN